MPLSRTTVEEIKARIPIEELISSYVKVEKSGRSFKARCPFHNEKTPSFFISPERGGYFCFGCGSKGDIFTFVEQFEGLDFKGALKVLAEKAGVPLVVDQKTDSDKDKLFKITEDACKYFEDQYQKSKIATDYVKSRGINIETRALFRIGWAPEGWQNLMNYLKTKGWNEGMMEKAGLIKKRESGTVSEGSHVVIPAKAGIQGHTQNSVSSSNTLDSRLRGNDTTPKGDVVQYGMSNYYDRFRGRVIFPITDSSGRVVAFTGRILKDDGKSAKYLNSPETPIFTKSQILFGLDKAKSEIRRVGYSILVEGQMDLVLSHQVGIKNAIAASGTALTDQSQGETGVVSNLGLVRRLSPNMIIALDSDKAGRIAAMRAVAATALSMGMSVKIADIEGGKDPADLILANPESWKTVLKNAKHVIEFELGNVVKEITDPHKLGRSIRERVFPFLARIDSEMDKAYFMKIISEQTHLNEQAVWEDLRKFEKTMKQSGVSSGGISSAPGSGISQGTGGASQTSSSTGSSTGNPYSNVQKSLNSSRPSNAATSTKTSSPTLRLDMVERRMFGLLSLLETANIAEAPGFRERIKKIAGDSYDARITRITPIAGDISFEAEAIYGDDKDRWNIHLNELIFNFEEDLISEELIQTMGKLRAAERDGNQAIVAEMAQKCQVLSMRKAEVGKLRRV